MQLVKCVSSVLLAVIPAALGGGSHAHGTSTGFDQYSIKCVCNSKTHGWLFDCTNKTNIENAVAYLEAHAECKKKGAPDLCQDNYYILQSHHDHCLHNQLPTIAEKKLHDYEAFYTDCEIKRQFNAKLPNCKAVTCSDKAAMDAALKTLTDTPCNTTARCAATACSAAIKLVLMAHDTCAENQLPTALEKGLHDYEEACEDQMCNSQPKVWDPWADACKAPANVLSHASRQVASLVTMSMLPITMLITFFA